MPNIYVNFVEKKVNSERTEKTLSGEKPRIYRRGQCHKARKWLQNLGKSILDQVMEQQSDA